MAGVSRGCAWDGADTRVGGRDDRGEGAAGEGWVLGLAGAFVRAKWWRMEGSGWGIEVEV